MLESMDDLDNFTFSPQCFSSDISFANNVSDLNLDIDLDIDVDVPKTDKSGTKGVKNVQLYMPLTGSVNK